MLCCGVHDCILCVFMVWLVGFVMNWWCLIDRMILTFCYPLSDYCDSNAVLWYEYWDIIWYFRLKVSGGVWHMLVSTTLTHKCIQFLPFSQMNTGLDSFEPSVCGCLCRLWLPQVPRKVSFFWLMLTHSWSTRMSLLISKWTLILM